MVVREGSNVTLRCAATGSPEPSITWRREGGEMIPLGNGQEGQSIHSTLIISQRIYFIGYATDGSVSLLLAHKLNFYVCIEFYSEL